MAYNFSPFKSKLSSIEEWMKGELLAVRTGRATPALLDSVHVPAYGSKMPINQVGSVTIEDSRTIRIQPWDTSINKAIEKAIIDSNLGISVVTDDKGLRVVFPELTAERRVLLAKLVREKLEQARVSLRGARQESLDDIQKREKDGEYGEDERNRYRDEMQKLIDGSNANLESIAHKKEQEIAS